MAPKVSSGSGGSSSSSGSSPVTTFLWILAIVLVLVILIALFGGCIRCRPSEPAVMAERLTMGGNTSTKDAAAMTPVTTSIGGPAAPAIAASTTSKPSAPAVSVSGAGAFRSSSGPGDVEPVDYSIGAGGSGLVGAASAAP